MDALLDGMVVNIFAKIVLYGYEYSVLCWVKCKDKFCMLSSAVCGLCRGAFRMDTACGGEVVWEEWYFREPTLRSGLYRSGSGGKGTRFA
jgi:hypothetical protein